MICQEVLERLSGFMDTELASPETEQVKVHLAECESCSKAMNELRQVHVNLQSAFSPVREQRDRLTQKAIHAVHSGGADAGPAPRPMSRRFRFAIPAAIAAGFLIALGLLWVLTSNSEKPVPGPVTTERQTIDFGAVGKVIVEPNSRFSVVRKSEELIKLRLELGTLHARISADARPRLFQVETDASTCIDLGCRYTLTVDPEGNSYVEVETGQVAFVDNQREVYVPAGAMCRASRKRGSGTPCWKDAPVELKEAVQAFDKTSEDHRVLGARDVVRLCKRTKDTLSIWHFLQDPDPKIVELAWDALVARTSAPAGITREATLRRDADALQAWKVYLKGFW